MHHQTFAVGSLYICLEDKNWLRGIIMPRLYKDERSQFMAENASYDTDEEVSFDRAVIGNFACANLDMTPPAHSGSKWLISTKIYFISDFMTFFRQ